MRLRLLLGLVLASLPACFLLEHKSESNVLLVVVDGLRIDAISQSIGAARTPNLQKLAAESLTFHACFAHSASTLAAHAAILSSRVPSTSGVRNDGQAVEAGVPLLTEYLQREGWQTFGDVSSSALVPQSPQAGLDRGFDVFRTHDHDGASAAEVNARLLPFLEHSSPDAPWFAYVQYCDPSTAESDPQVAPTMAQVFLDGTPIGSARTDDEESWRVELDLTPGPHRIELRSESPFSLRRLDCFSSRTRLPPVLETGHLFTPLTAVVAAVTNDQDALLPVHIEARVRAVQTLEKCRARYKQQVETVDRAVGEIVESLKKSGRYDDTLIVITGSHGESLGEHGITGHDVTLFDEMLRVPLLVKPIASEDRRVELARHQFELVRHVDIAPTILELVGEMSLAGAEGLSLLREGERELVAETHPPEAPSTICALRDDRYKLVYTAQEDRFEMYDVKSDTLEMENLFALQGHFRSKWQLDLRALAQNAPQGADLHMSFAPKVDTSEKNDTPRAAKR